MGSFPGHKWLFALRASRFVMPAKWVRFPYFYSPDNRIGSDFEVGTVLAVINATVCIVLVITGCSFTKGYAVAFSAELVVFL